jgi:hypothetical protein
VFCDPPGQLRGPGGLLPQPRGVTGGCGNSRDLDLRRAQCADLAVLLDRRAANAAVGSPRPDPPPRLSAVVAPLLSLSQQSESGIIAFGVPVKDGVPRQQQVIVAAESPLQQDAARRLHQEITGR